MVIQVIVRTSHDNPLGWLIYSALERPSRRHIRDEARCPGKTERQKRKPVMRLSHLDNVRSITGSLPL